MMLIILDSVLILANLSGEVQEYLDGDNGVARDGWSLQVLGSCQC